MHVWATILKNIKIDSCFAKEIITFKQHINWQNFPQMKAQPLSIQFVSISPLWHHLKPMSHSSENNLPIVKLRRISHCLILNIIIFITLCAINVCFKALKTWLLLIYERKECERYYLFGWLSSVSSSESLSLIKIGTCLGS